MSITVVSLNPCIDWQLTTPTLTPGGLNRVQEAGRYAAGKGINVAIALKNLSLNPICTGFNFKENGEIITRTLEKYGVTHDFVTVEGAVRTNIKLYDTATSTMTELNQPGSFVSDEAIAKLRKKLEEIASPSQIKADKNQILILSGSLPAGVPTDIYAQLCNAWPGVVILDAEGEALRLAIAGDTPPFCIKPNLYELESCFDVKLTTKEDIIALCKSLLQKYNMYMICVSMGADGALLVSKTTTHYSPALDLDVRGVQGAGDSMVAGLAYGLSLDAPEDKLLRAAQAAAAASVVREGTLMCTKEDFMRYSADLQVVSV